MASAAAKRHAHAAFQIALERNELESWRGDLDQLAEAVKDPLLLAFLENPKINLEDKTSILRQVLEGLNPLVINLAMLLVSRGRLNIVSGIASEYGRMVDEQKGIAHAEVVTAIPLGADDVAELARRLSGVLGREIVLSTSVSPDIIGGLIAKVGDKLIDGSTKSKFLALKKSMGGSAK